MLQNVAGCAVYINKKSFTCRGSPEGICRCKCRFRLPPHLPKILHSFYTLYKISISLNYETVLPVVFVILHLNRLKRLLPFWPLMWILSVGFSSLVLTLILWTKYVNIHNVMYVGCLQKNTLHSNLDGHVHVHCTDGQIVGTKNVSF